MQVTKSESGEFPLEGKVALLFDGASTNGRSLAISLAKFGADIALVYRQAYSARAKMTKGLVEAEGRSCLIISAQANDKISSEDVIRQTVNALGRLDIYIDYSSSSRPEIEPDDAEDTDDGNSLEEVTSDGQKHPFTNTNVEIMSAALDQIVHLERSEVVDNETRDVSNKKEQLNMRVAKELINKPIISVNEGKKLGKVEDFYLDHDLTQLVAIYLGSEGLISRKETLIDWSDVVTFGQDAILVKDANCVMEKAEVEEVDTYMRRDDISGRPVDTPGGTKIGRIGDVILDDEAKVAGYSLTQVFVSGPVAKNRTVSRAAVVDNGNEDGVMTADLSEAEKANLQVVHEGIFAEPTVNPAESEKVSPEIQT